MALIIFVRGKQYIAQEQKHAWKISQQVGKVQIDFEVSKSEAEDEDALRKYMNEHTELF